MTNPLKIQSLSCIRQTKALFDGLCLELGKGEVLLVEGSNGSGKSSLLKLLAGLATPYSGDILWQGQSIQRSLATYWENIHYVGHTNGIKLGLTVEENLQLACHLSLSTLTQLETTLTCLKLNSHRHTLTKHLSAGQKRRVALAKLFLIPKALWILDEPFTALDAEIQSFLLIKLENHLKNGGIAVISTHQLIPFKNITPKTWRIQSC